jgi:hypothetical protein
VGVEFVKGLADVGDVEWEWGGGLPVVGIFKVGEGGG